MSVANPDTMSEWMEYVSILGPDEITNKARVANTKNFADKLLAEGFTTLDVHAILEAFARKFLDLDIYPPKGGMLDLPMLAKSPAVQNLALPDPETVEWEPEPDEVDRQIDELDLETEWEDESEEF